MAKVTVVTATTGNPLLANNIESVARQTHADIQHIVIVDGPERRDAVNDIINHMNVEHLHKVVVHTLPYSIGKDRWNGHRIYGMSTYLAEGQHIMYLDDDNSIDPTHIEDCLKVIEAGNDWAYSMRKIRNKECETLCLDDCESLGQWPSVLDNSDYFIDVNCYFLPINLAVTITPVWYRKFREPGQMEIDRAMIRVLGQIAPKFDSTRNYTVNYTVGNTQNSVQAGFFEAGNAEMLRRYEGKLPWKKAQ